MNIVEQPAPVTNAKESVLVLGGGIAGLQAAIDLAANGFRVYLVERTPSLGGRMAQLDKTFPTNDCAMCILAPKMIECAAHPKITLLTYCELEKFSGIPGTFTAIVRKKSRFVDEQKCTGCGRCAEECRVEVPSEFELGLATRKAIYRPFPQAVPNVFTITRGERLPRKGKSKRVRYSICVQCRRCEKACEANAIDLKKKDELLTLEVGACVVATGFRMMLPTLLPEYGGGRIKNVVTGLEFERLLSASGPTGGQVRRPSDSKAPKRLAFIQCAGSRDVRHHAYCSAVCCMHATKEAILAHEHDPGLSSTIFYVDLRATGKTFQDYVARAREQYAVTYVRARPGRLEEAEETGDVRVVYEDTMTREKTSALFDLAVLCQALLPAGSGQVARLLGVELDGHGFIRIPDPLGRPVDTTVPGVYAAGYAAAPQDIPDSVVQASAAAARVAERPYAVP